MLEPHVSPNLQIRDELIGTDHTGCGLCSNHLQNSELKMRDCRFVDWSSIYWVSAMFQAHRDFTI